MNPSWASVTPAAFALLGVDYLAHIYPTLESGPAKYMVFALMVYGLTKYLNPSVGFGGTDQKGSRIPRNERDNDLNGLWNRQRAFHTMDVRLNTTDTGRIMSAN